MNERAYAKINIGLHLLGRRPDGYREIETVFHRIDLYDDLSFAPSGSLTLACSDPSLPVDASNLCLKAAALLQQHSSPSRGAAISLTKRIPLGAGLGGGSSDAAATLRGLSRLWDLRISSEELARIALEAGSDVPFFLGKGSALGRGRGELLEYFHLDLPSWIVVAYPNVHVSTAWAYENSAIPARPAGASLRETVLGHRASPQRYMTLLRNDFEPLVLRTHPVVAELKQSLYLQGAEFAQMSGSGSSVYGLFQDEERARAAAEAMRGHRVSVTPPHFQPE